MDSSAVLRARARCLGESTSEKGSARTSLQRGGVEHAQLEARAVNRRSTAASISDSEMRFWWTASTSDLYSWPQLVSVPALTAVALAWRGHRASSDDLGWNRNRRSRAIGSDKAVKAAVLVKIVLQELSVRAGRDVIDVVVRAA